VNDDVSKRRRRSIRLRGYDYAQAGSYFVTIVTKDRVCLFGEIVEMRLNDKGGVIDSVWDELPDHYPGIERDVFVVMPNHVHGIIVLADEGDVRESDVGAGLKPARGMGVGPNSVKAGLKPAPTLAEIIRGFKTFSARRVNELRETPGVPVWQRNYYEHIVRAKTN
jgi:putative transposase